MSQITTHVLDTSRGIPAEGIKITLQKPSGNDQWEDITSGITNKDGRIQQFMSDTIILSPGVYRMLFETKDYFEALDVDYFYPYAGIVFHIKDSTHYHIPLLLNPFGYSTYRGS